MRSNTTICLSFGKDEIELLTLLDEGRKKEYLSRSAWFKNKIREEYGKKKTFKEFRDDVRKRKVRKGRKQNDEYYSSQGTKASPEKGTRLGGSTSVLLPEPRARTMAQGVEINHSPPAPQQEF
jgi:hypothetical protein